MMSAVVRFAPPKNVAWPSLANRDRNRLATVDLHAVLHTSFLQSHYRIIDNRQRVFATRIIRSQHYEVAAPPRGFAHQRTLLPVAIPAASKHR